MPFSQYDSLAIMVADWSRDVHHLFCVRVEDDRPPTCDISERLAIQSLSGLRPFSSATFSAGDLIFIHFADWISVIPAS